MLVKLLRNRLQLSKAESNLTPQGLLDLVERKPWAAPFLAKLPLAKGESAVRFESQIFSDELVLFTGMGQPRNLLVCFTDKHWHLFLPVPLFLQALGNQGFDVMIVHDRRRGRHRLGLDGLSGSLWETCQTIARKIDLTRYQSLTTFGSSMGGFAALRAGLLLNARKAVGIGGSFSNHTGWYEATSGFLPAFDEICDCADTGKTVFELYYSINSHDDKTNALMMEQVLPGLRLFACDTRKHNIFPELDRRGTTRAFLHAILGEPRDINLGDYYGDTT